MSSLLILKKNIKNFSWTNKPKSVIRKGSFLIFLMTDLV